MRVLDPQAAGALLCRRLYCRHRVLLACAADAVVIGIGIGLRGSRIPLLQRAWWGGTLRLRSGRRARTAFGGVSGTPPTTRNQGGALPGELREPRRAGGRRNCPARKP